MKIDRQRAERAASEALVAHGISESDATLTARVLVSADACGKHSHGLLRLPRFVRGIAYGNVDPTGEIAVDHGSEAVGLLDGGARLGPVVADRAVTEGIEIADQFGIGAVGVHNTNHLGMLGYYTNEARSEGYICIGLTNTEPAMPPYGGAEPILGTNPLAIGLPTDPPFNLDMSTSSISRGEVVYANEHDEELPEGCALDTNGEPTVDPAAALDGVILPFGGPKGSGLAVAVEILAGGLVQAAMGQAVTGTYRTEQPCTKGDLFIVIDPAAFGDGFSERVNGFIESMKHSQRGAEIRLPGEHSIREMDSSEKIEIDSDRWEEIQSLAESQTE